MLGWLILIGFVASILWSMWVDTLQPVIRTGDTRALILHMIGLPVILLGAGIFVYGGLLFVRRTFNAMGAPQTAETMALMRDGKLPPKN